MQAGAAAAGGRAGLVGGDRRQGRRGARKGAAGPEEGEVEDCLQLH